MTFVVWAVSPRRRWRRDLPEWLLSGLATSRAWEPLPGIQRRPTSSHRRKRCRKSYGRSSDHSRQRGGRSLARGPAPITRNFPDRRLNFLDPANFFPDTVPKFPVRRHRELPHETRGIPGMSASRIGPDRLQNRGIPCIFPWNSEFDGGDRFAQDWFLRQLIDLLLESSRRAGAARRHGWRRSVRSRLPHRPLG
jgi:hypothetical protein